MQRFTDHDLRWLQVDIVREAPDQNEVGAAQRVLGSNAQGDSQLAVHAPVLGVVDYLEKDRSGLLSLATQRQESEQSAWDLLRHIHRAVLFGQQGILRASHKHTAKVHCRMSRGYALIMNEH